MADGGSGTADTPTCTSEEERTDTLPENASMTDHRSGAVDTHPASTAEEQTDTVPGASMTGDGRGAAVNSPTEDQADTVPEAQEGRFFGGRASFFTPTSTVRPTPTNSTDHRWRPTFFKALSISFLDTPASSIDEKDTGAGTDVTFLPEGEGSGRQLNHKQQRPAPLAVDEGPAATTRARAVAGPKSTEGQTRGLRLPVARGFCDTETLNENSVGGPRKRTPSKVTFEAAAPISVSSGIREVSGKSLKNEPPPLVQEGRAAAIGPALQPSSNLPKVKTLVAASRKEAPDAAVKVLENMEKACVTQKLDDVAALIVAAKGGHGEVVQTAINAMLEALTVQKVAELLSLAFHHTALETINARDSEQALAALSVLLQHGTKPHHEDLTLLAHVVSLEKLDDCFFGALCSAKNTFIPGSNLSFALDDAMVEAREAERKVLYHLRLEVDKVLTEVLRWLPQHVRGVSGGMGVCMSLFEPEMTNARVTDGAGPLSEALSCANRIVTFATTPLGMDYMFTKFTRGLPSPKDSARVIVLEAPHLDPREEGKMQESLTVLCGGSWLGWVFKAAGTTLTGGTVCGLTLFPGVHFIATGMVAMPNSYYKVPVVRMVLDLLVYMAVLALFTKAALFHEDGAVAKGEIAYIFCVVASIMTEISEMRRDIREYLLDRWNVLDMMALQISLIAFAVRVVDSDSVWGRSLYALSAPLMYWRLLFFAQILPFQGAIIQVIFNMTTELVQFAVVMVVVMLGFVVSFFALFKGFDDSSFPEAWLYVFKAMLGEVGFFDDFIGSPYQTMATLLLSLYLVIMAIMLLNLLVAVLSTAHSNMEQNVLIRVSKARLFMYYRWVVASDTLPPPLNLMQLAVSLPLKLVDTFFVGCGGFSHGADKLVGRTLFWLFMGPLAVLAGSLLWLVSLPKALIVVNNTSYVARSMVCVPRLYRSIVCVLWCLFGVPLCLCLSWLTRVASVTSGKTGVLESAHAPRSHEASVESVLKEATGGLGMHDLRAYLKDPVTSHRKYNLSQGDRARAPTLEHMKLLRERLEGTTKEKIDELKIGLEERMAVIIEEKLKVQVRRLEHKIDVLLESR